MVFDIATLLDGTSLILGGRCSNSNIIPQNVIVIGSSGAGKTTLVNFIKTNTDLFIQKQINVPLRYVTRAQRENDDLSENRPVAKNEFQKLVDNETINVYWQRDLGGTEKESYGFVATPPGHITLYSANNAIIKPDAGLHPQHLLKNSLIIGVYSSDDARKKRLSQRSPDILKNKVEASIRLAGDDIFPYADIIIDNSNSKDKMGQDLEALLRKLIHIKY